MKPDNLIGWCRASCKPAVSATPGYQDSHSLRRRYGGFPLRRYGMNLHVAGVIMAPRLRLNSQRVPLHTLFRSRGLTAQLRPQKSPYLKIGAALSTVIDLENEDVASAVSAEAVCGIKVDILCTHSFCKFARFARQFGFPICIYAPLKESAI